MRPRVNIRNLATASSRGNRFDGMNQSTTKLNQSSLEFRAPQEQIPIPLTLSRSRPLGSTEADRLNTTQLFQEHSMILHDTGGSSNTMNQTMNTTTTVIQPQPQSGQIIDLFITVSGIIAENSSQILPLFYNIGPISNKYFINNNQLQIIEFFSPSESREALKLDGVMIANVVLGVRPTQICDFTPDIIDDVQIRYGPSCLDPTSPTSDLNITMNQTTNQNNITTGNIGDNTMNNTQLMANTSLNQTSLQNSILNQSIMGSLQPKIQPGSIIDQSLLISSPHKQQQHQQQQRLNTSIYNTSTRSLNTTTNTLNTTANMTNNNNNNLNTTMAISSPNLLQRRRQPHQSLVCVDPFDLDTVTPSPLSTLIHTSNTRGLATYEEHVRNRGCWSKFCAYFSNDY